MANLHVDDYGYAGEGGSGEPLLLIHGWGMHGGMWGSVAEKLRQHFRVMAVDLPGHGYSSPPSPAGGRGAGGEGLGAINETLTLTLSRQRERGLNLLDALVDELAARFAEPLVREPLTICGWSLGGQIALRWALRQPQQVRRLVLVATTPCFVHQADWPCAMPVETLAEFDAALLQNFSQTLRRFLALQVRGSDKERELLASLRSVLFSRGEPDLHALQGGLRILRDCDLRSALPGIKQAALVIAGVGDTLAPLPAAEYLASHLPNARLARIKGAAHTPFLSHPDEFLESVVNFLNE